MITLEAFMLKQYSPKAVVGYVCIAVRYISYMNEKAVPASYADVLDYIGHLRKTGLHPKSLINHLFVIKIYYRWLVATNQRTDHPCQTLILQDQVNKKIPVDSLYSKKTLEELLKNHKSKHKHAQKRDEVMISLLIYQAMTVQEIAAINLDDVNLKEATIKATGGYKQKSRLLALQANQIMLLLDYLNQDRKLLLKRNKRLTMDDKKALVLGNTGNRILSAYVCKHINSSKEKHERLSPMKIRQSVIAHLLKSKNDLRVVQVFAGHKRAGSTEEYKQTSLEELKTIIQNLHPLDSEQN